MARSLERFGGDSEAWGRAAVGYAALLLLPPLLLLVVLAAKFQGLEAPLALDHAQLARNLATGQGWATDVIRPLSLRFKADLRHHPDLLNPPGHPFVLALFYRLLHPSDKVTAGAGAALWLLSLWLVFLVARRWFDPGVAALAALFYGCNVPALAAALSGLPQPLLAGEALLALALAFPPENVGQSVRLPPPVGQTNSLPYNPDLPGWRVALIGLVSALAVLTHYLMSALPLALGIYLVVSQEDRKRALLAFLAGFLLPLLPWMGWTFHTVGSPFFSLFGYELLAHTRTYPGEMIWRLGTAPPPPFAFLFQHPLDLPHKFLVGLNQFYDTTLDLVNPVVGFLFVGALLSGFAPGPALGGLKVAGSSLLLGVGLSCLFRPEPGLLLAWAPLLAVGAAAALTAWTRRGLESGEWDRFPRWREWLGGMIHLGVILLVGFPLFFFLLISRPGPGPQLAQWAVPVAEQVAAGGVVMTDQPFLVAWYADRPAVWLLQQEEDWERLERTMEAVDALYLTAAWQQIPAPERGRWWYWLASPQGAYRDFAPAPRQWPQGVLRVRDQPEAPPEHGGS